MTSCRPRTSHARRSLLTVDCAIFIYLLAMLPLTIYAVDGRSMYSVSASIAVHGTLTVPRDVGSLGRGGQYYSIWYPLLSIIATPAVFIAYHVAGLFHISGHYAGMIGGLLVQSVIVSLTASFVMRLARLIGYWSPLSIVLIFLFGTVEFVYARTFFAEPLLGLCSVAAFYFLVCDTQRVGLVAVFCGLAVLAKPTGVLLVIPCIYYLRVRPGGNKPIIVTIAGTAGGSALYAAYDFYRFGSPFAAGPRPGWGVTQFPQALIGQLLSPGRGLLLFCPVLIVALVIAFKHRTDIVVRTLVLWPTMLLLVYSFRPYDWFGGESWGPRFLVPALPGLIVLLARARPRQRQLANLCAILAFLFNSATLVSFTEWFPQSASASGVSQSQLLWYPPDSLILRGWPAAVEEVTKAKETPVSRIVSHATDRQSKTHSATISTLDAIDIWWWALPAFGISYWYGITIWIAMIGLFALLLMRGARSVSSDRNELARDPPRALMADLLVDD